MYVRVSRRKLISRHAAAAPVGRFGAVWQEVWELRGWLRRFRGVSIRWLQSYLTWFMALRRAGAVITPADEVSYAAAG
ncbi:MAG: hypothetical protein IMW99_04530 [Firmicutes bacterium]|nr:hypothetical protein [Bacillota bacterium]